jgi:hypothetical protein
VETPELLLECDLAALLLRWRDCVTRPVTATVCLGGLVGTVTLTPSHAITVVHDDDIPTPCEAAILRLLSDGQRRLRPAIVDALERDHAESTIVKALARLVKSGRLNRVNRRGYAIAEVRAD